MAYDHKAVIQSQYESLAADLAQTQAEYEAARLREDATETMRASRQILELDAQVAALEQRARGMIAQEQQQPRGNAYGLSDEEMQVAKASHSGGTVEERIREYAENKARYRHMRASGQYRDDQGSVRR